MTIRSVFRLMASVAVALGLTACATSMPIPRPAAAESSGIGIDISMRVPAGFFTKVPDQVFFARVDGVDGILQQQIIRSNYIVESRAYLLNARPGTYVAVAALFRGAVGTYSRPTTYTTYFSQDLIEQSKVLVKANELVFAGRYRVEQTTGMGSADSAQTHYQNVISPGAITTGLLHILSGEYHYRGALLERNADAQARSVFFTAAKKDLAGSPWAERIETK
jgi:hypothetical protein